MIFPSNIFLLTLTIKAPVLVSEIMLKGFGIEFVFVPAGKADNSIVIVCRKCYIDSLRNQKFTNFPTNSILILTLTNTTF